MTTHDIDVYTIEWADDINDVDVDGATKKRKTLFYKKPRS